MRAASFIAALLLVVVIVLTLGAVFASANTRVPVVAGETSGPYNPNEPDGTDPRGA